LPIVPAGPAPPMHLADSLASAQPRAFVHVDSEGQVRSPTRYKVLQAASYAAAGSVVAAVTGVYGALLGPPGVLIGLGLGAYLGWHVRRGRRLQEAVTLLAHDRLEEAEQMLNEVRFSFRCPRPLRAMAEQNLGSIASRRGDYETALEHQRQALVLYARMRRKNPMRQLTEYAEVVTLVNLGRTGEARQRFDARVGDGPPAGDYLKLQHWVAELYVCLAEGSHRIDGDELHARARIALAVNGAAALLGLLAWAEHEAGDREFAWHLLREAFDRRRQLHLKEGLPLLHAWMEANAEAAEVDVKELEAREAEESA
jgi:tetratricopeptide (TPR) repeat protein